ncbi:MAG: glutamine synthetase type III, partial [Lentisphaeria bacterium]
MKKHGRVIFNGNGYSDEWREEAGTRGLPNITDSIGALLTVNSPQSIAMFDKYKVLSEAELKSRTEIYLEQYSKQINVEAATALEMIRKLYRPTTISYAKQLADAVIQSENAGVKPSAQKSVLKEVNEHITALNGKTEVLEKALIKAQSIMDIPEQAEAYRDRVRPAVSELRGNIDALENLTPKANWPVPSYADMMFLL